MPSTYTHRRFGEDVRRLLPESNAASIIKAFPEPFQIGLHGPDPFFYYKPLQKTSIPAAGHQMHTLSGREFFSRMKEKLAAIPAEVSRPYLSYVYGVLCHFALDSICHGRVNKGVEETGVDHISIEGDLDRILMLRDKKDPVRYLPTDHLIPSLNNAVVIGRLYDGMTTGIVLDAIKGMLSFNKIFLCDTPAKRAAIINGMKLVGMHKSHRGMILNPQPNPDCIGVVNELCSLYEKALPLAVKLIGGFGEENALNDPAYALNFESLIP